MSEKCQQYRKKPVIIEAWEFHKLLKERMPEPIWLKKALKLWPNRGGVAFDLYHPQGPRIAISTLEGIMNAVLGDWIIQGIQGELYPCKPDIFEATYDKVKERIQDVRMDRC